MLFGTNLAQQKNSIIFCFVLVFSNVCSAKHLMILRTDELRTENKINRKNDCDYKMFKGKKKIREFCVFESMYRLKEKGTNVI